MVKERAVFSISTDTQLVFRRRPNAICIYARCDENHEAVTYEVFYDSINVNRKSEDRDVVISHRRIGRQEGGWRG